MKASYLFGRMIFGGYFLYAGIHHFQETEAMAQYTASKGFPAPKLAVKATGIALIAGGASVLLGLKKEWGAAAIASFLAGVSPLMHDFWKQADPEQRQNEMVNFSKNMALLGASLAFMGMEKPSKQTASDWSESKSEQDWRPVHKHRKAA
jgi:putative oxidoreductase